MVAMKVGEMVVLMVEMMVEPKDTWMAAMKGLRRVV